MILGERQFAFVMGTSIYFAVDDATRPAYQASGSRPFLYETRDGVKVVEAYYRLPRVILNDKAALIEWARRASETSRPKRRSPRSLQ